MPTPDSAMAVIALSASSSPRAFSKLLKKSASMSASFAGSAMPVGMVVSVDCSVMLRVLISF